MVQTQRCVAETGRAKGYLLSALTSPGTESSLRWPWLPHPAARLPASGPWPGWRPGRGPPAGPRRGVEAWVLANRCQPGSGQHPPRLCRRSQRPSGLAGPLEVRPWPLSRPRSSYRMCGWVGGGGGGGGRVVTCGRHGSAQVWRDLLTDLALLPTDAHRSGAGGAARRASVSASASASTCCTCQKQRSGCACAGARSRRRLVCAGGGVRRDKRCVSARREAGCAGTSAAPAPASASALASRTIPSLPPETACGAAVRPSRLRRGASLGLLQAVEAQVMRRPVAPSVAA